ncbi:ATP-dependent zinc protease family protein [Ostreiculturibacter nitratireducens]|uniref:ATP-dependent zinc protease family protein n=1 Tax=Ostreiculturibacter nitratireducens TaxID=3075226 RepID=UPI0031B57E0C
MDKLLIGWRETVFLPDLGLAGFKSKVDTGARTTALHANNISEIEIRGTPWVEFLPDHDVLQGTDICVCPVAAIREVTNTSGIPVRRYFIKTRLRIGEREAEIELSLSDRSDMTFPMIVGRTALRQLRLLVDPARSWLVSPKTM